MPRAFERPDFPFAPSRLPFFYGWVIVAAATLGTLMSVPGQTIGVGIFTDHLVEALAITRVELSGAYLVGTCASGVILPYAGRLLDRHGARRVVVVACVGLGATLVYLSTSDRLTALLRRTLGETGEASAAPALAVLTLGFFLVRFWGQGVLTMVSRAMLGKWFERRRGLVSGISGVLVAGGFSLAPTVFDALVERLGWRETWQLLALACAVVTVLGWLLYRDNPEECGLRMDGETPDAGAADADPSSPSAAIPPPGGGESDLSLLEALRTYPFWVANLALALQGLVITAVTFHITALGESAGLDRGAAVGVFVPMAAVSVLGNLVGGWIADRTRLKYLFWVKLAALAVGSSGLAAFSTAMGRALVVAGFGLAGGLFAMLLVVVWPRFYGRRHLGSITSVNMSIMVLGSAIGPWSFAATEAATGGYEAAALGSAAVAILLLVASLGLEAPIGRRASVG